MGADDEQLAGKEREPMIKNDRLQDYKYWWQKSKEAFWRVRSHGIIVMGVPSGWHEDTQLVLKHAEGAPL